MATAPIAGLWASWTNLNEVVDVEKYAAPQTMQWTKKQVRDQFQSKDVPPISCPHLPAPSIPAAIATINESRNNAPAMEYYTSQNPFWLAHRILFQAQFQSVVRFTIDECYFMAEEGELSVQINGRPLTALERLQLDFEPEKMDMRNLQPTDVKMQKGVAMRIPRYTVYSFKVVRDSLVTAGCIVRRGSDDE
jgi:hypothetical protein